MLIIIVISKFMRLINSSVSGNYKYLLFITFRGKNDTYISLIKKLNLIAI